MGGWLDVPLQGGDLRFLGRPLKGKNSPICDAATGAGGQRARPVLVSKQGRCNAAASRQTGKKGMPPGK
jgi:hypothetical protein